MPAAERLRPLIHRDAIQLRVRHLAGQIDRALPVADLLVLPLLGGAFCFVADLVRHLHMPGLQLHFGQASSYRGGTTSSGEVVLQDMPACEGRAVLVVDDILDTGRTLQAVHDHLHTAGAAGVHSCVLLDKPARRVAAVQADFVGFRIPDRFVVGYGLDYEERYRHLPDICELRLGPADG